ncbi:hypothetical protein [Streptomyces sp. NPDC088246]|uniref:ATP-dependent DNA ligase n=1 Tax=Streptomyces sp. NPDC088246 TaxID=3365842 RepID=UPI00380743C3
MLARSVTTMPSPTARTLLFEQKADGFRSLVFTGQEPYIQSRRGADLGGTFPELARAASELGVEAVLDGELVVWEAHGLDFPALQERARRRGATAQRAVRERPAHLFLVRPGICSTKVRRPHAASEQKNLRTRRHRTTRRPALGTSAGNRR